MKPEEVEIMRKTGGKGLADVAAKMNAKRFVPNPDNQETCFNFAKDNNLILQAENAGRMKMQEHIRSALPEILSVLNRQLVRRF